MLVFSPCLVWLMSNRTHEELDRRFPSRWGLTMGTYINTLKIASVSVHALLGAYIPYYTSKMLCNSIALYIVLTGEKKPNSTASINRVRNSLAFVLLPNCPTLMQQFLIHLQR